MGRSRVALKTKQRIPVSPEIVCKLKSNVTAAYYYTQLLYYDQYSDKDVEGWFDRNTREIEDDIGLNRRQQQHSRSLLVEKGWIETKSVRGGLRPTVRFKIIIRHHST